MTSGTPAGEEVPGNDISLVSGQENPVPDGTIPEGNQAPAPEEPTPESSGIDNSTGPGPQVSPATDALPENGTVASGPGLAGDEAVPAVDPNETRVDDGTNGTENGTLLTADPDATPLNDGIPTNGTLLVEEPDALLFCDGMNGTVNSTFLTFDENETLMSNGENSTANDTPYGLHDPPLNSTNWLGSPGSYYWEINESGYYPIDWFNYAGDFVGGVLTTVNPYAILIQASNVVLDGMGLLINGTADNGIIVNDSSQNVMVTNFTVMDKNYGIYYDGVTYNESATTAGDLATGGYAAPVPNVISDVNASYNTLGIFVNSSVNVTLIGNTAKGNLNGIGVNTSENLYPGRKFRN